MALSIKAESLLGTGDITITNSLLTAIIIVISLMVFFTWYGAKMKVSPISRFQLIIEWIVESLYGLCKDVLGSKQAKNLFPLIFTFFTFIILSNWFGLLPITGSVGFAEKKHAGEESGVTLPSLVIPFAKAESHEDEKASDEKHEETEGVTVSSKYEIVPFFRSPSADLNFTLALAIISFFLIQISALSGAGFHYLGKYFDYRVAIGKGWKILLTPVMFIINFFWKTLELVLEFSKILSFSFRLFGNIFAGEVLLLVITSLTFGVFTLPFIGFELFVGFIQAIVFIFLTMVFIKVSVEHH